MVKNKHNDAVDDDGVEVCDERAGLDVAVDGDCVDGDDASVMDGGDDGGGHDDCAAER